MQSDPSISLELLVYNADGRTRWEASRDEVEDGGGQFTETLKTLGLTPTKRGKLPIAREHKRDCRE